MSDIYEPGWRTVVWRRIDSSQLENVKSETFDMYRRYKDAGCLGWDFEDGIFVVRVYVSESETDEEKIRIDRIDRAEFISMILSVIRVD